MPATERCIRRATRWLVATACAGGLGLVSAQVPANEAEWREAAAPPPPAFDLKTLVAFDGPVSSSLKFGVDPNTLQIGPDGVVRYVVVATSPSGVVNAMHEGIRCATAQVKTYARHHPTSGWNVVAKPEWQPLYGNAGASHSLRLAAQGVCTGAAPASTVGDIVKALRGGPLQNLSR